MELKRNDAGTPLWQVEQGRRVHTSTGVMFDEPVDPDDLERALDRTLAIFPVVRSRVVMKDGTTWFAENPEPVPILHRKTGIIPGSDSLNGHWLFVIYDDCEIRLAISHVITDGSGILRFFRTLVYFYCCIHDGTDYAPGDVTAVPIPAERQDADFWNLDYSDVSAVKPAVYEKTGFVLPSMQPSEYKRNIRSVLSVSEPEFMRFVKEHRTSPSVMAFLLFASAVYECHKEAQGMPVVGRITVDARRALGIPDTMRNCSLGAHMSVREEDVTREHLASTGERLRQLLKEQVAPGYIRSLAATLAETRMFPRDVKPTVSISYMGEIDFGSFDRHIRSIHLYEGEFHKLNIYVFRGYFYFVFLMGEDSARYAGAVSECLAQAGITAEVSGNEMLEDETYT